ncbi:MAG: hypothetical protein P1U40_02785 [Coxiellaceae bacterium]|nr:hypothetical protein [Coxiellaceae bacterium]
MRDSTKPRVISAYMPAEPFSWSSLDDEQVAMWVQRLSTILADNGGAETLAIVIPGTTDQAREVQSHFNASFGEPQRDFTMDWGVFRVNAQTDAVIALLQTLQAAQDYISEHKDPEIKSAAKSRFDRMRRLVNLLRRLKIIVMPIVAPYSGWGAFASSAMQAATVDDMTAAQLALDKVVTHERGIIVPILDEHSVDDDPADRIGRLRGKAVESVAGASCALTIATTTLSVIAKKFGHSAYPFADVPKWDAPTYEA